LEPINHGSENTPDILNVFDFHIRLTAVECSWRQSTAINS